MNRNRNLVTLLALALLLALAVGPGLAQGPTPPDTTGVTASTLLGASLGTGFTYQGQIKNASGPVNSTCDFQFTLWDDAGSGSPPAGGNQIGLVQTTTGVSVTNGLFTVQLNGGGEFGGNAFNGDARWLQIAVQCAGDPGYTTLSPRQSLTPAPYALFAKTIYRRTIVVSPAGTATENGTALLDALAGITDASGANPYLIKLEPGVYDLGTSTLQMKEHVDIEGSGEWVTKITAAGSASLNTGTVKGSDMAELRFLGVWNSGGNTYAAAIFNDHTSPRLTHVTAYASGGTSNYGVYNSYATPTMTDMTAHAIGGTNCTGVVNYHSTPTMVRVNVEIKGGTGNNYGVFNSSSSPLTMSWVNIDAAGGANCRGLYNLYSSVTIQNSTIYASAGTSNTGIYNEAPSGLYTVNVNNCQITANTNTIYNDTGTNNYTANVGASWLNGGPAIGAGTETCAGVYDEGYTFYIGPACP
jgi:hypothetical protein